MMDTVPRMPTRKRLFARVLYVPPDTSSLAAASVTKMGSSTSSSLCSSASSSSRLLLPPFFLLLRTASPDIFFRSHQVVFYPALPTSLPVLFRSHLCACASVPRLYPAQTSAFFALCSLLSLTSTNSNLPTPLYLSKVAANILSPELLTFLWKVLSSFLHNIKIRFAGFHAFTLIPKLG